MTQQISSVNDRASHVNQALANHAIEGFQPDEADKLLLSRYVSGQVSVEDLLNQARLFALHSKKAGIS